MLIRVLGLLVGAGALIMTFSVPFEPRSIMFFIIGAAFVTYGIGGQKLLEKIAPQYSEKHKKK